MTKILLVEDDNQIREIITDYFNSKYGEELILEEAVTGDEGREKIENDNYDLILLDVMLPFEIVAQKRCRSYQNAFSATE